MKVLSSKKEDWGGLHRVLESVPKSVHEAMANAASEAFLLEGKVKRRNSI
jgi:hypothetical protein